jgi:ankyrin repeat protein
LNLTDYQNATPLVYGMLYGDIDEDTVIDIFKKGLADPHFQYQGADYLFLAASQGYDRTFVYLYEKVGGFTLDKKGPEGMPLIVAAAHSGNKKIVTYLLEKGVSVDEKDDRYGRTALWAAAENGDVPMVHLLLEHGANPNLADKKGKTPLHATDSFECMALLLQHGADPNTPDKYGRTPLYMIVDFSHDPLDVAKMVGLMLENGADPNIALKDNGRTPLHAAVANGYLAAIDLLLRKGADVNAKEEGKNTPLDTALNAYHIKDAVVRYLICKGAEPGMPKDKYFESLSDSEKAKLESLLAPCKPYRKKKKNFSPITVPIGFFTICSEVRTPMPSMNKAITSFSL